jgi:hypothetical protein
VCVCELLLNKSFNLKPTQWDECVDFKTKISANVCGMSEGGIFKLVQL